MKAWFESNLEVSSLSGLLISLCENIAGAYVCKY
jgi:hypothetical protein